MIEETITRHDVAAKLRAYLKQDLELKQLVAWAEAAMQEAEFEEAGFDSIRDAVARLGLSDVRAFGLSWEDCQQLLARLGYKAEVEVHQAG